MHHNNDENEEENDVVLLSNVDYPLDTLMKSNVSLFADNMTTMTHSCVGQITTAANPIFPKYLKLVAPH